jgi:hypothetical protein
MTFSPGNLRAEGKEGEGKQRTYIIPDGHDEHHGNGEGLVQLVEAANLRKAVAVIKGLEHGRAKLGGDGGAVLREAVPLGGRDLDLLSVLDEELGELVLLEPGHDAVMVHVRVSTATYCHRLARRGPRLT